MVSKDFKVGPFSIRIEFHVQTYKDGSERRLLCQLAISSCRLLKTLEQDFPRMNNSIGKRDGVLA